MDKATERSHLRKADAGIAKGRERIAHQRELIARLARDGHDTATAQALLQTLCDTVAVMEEHRQLIVKELSG